MTQKKPKKAANKKPVKKKVNPKVAQLKELRKKRDDARKKFDALQAEKKKRRDKIASILEKNMYSSDAEDALIQQLKLKDDPLLRKIIVVLLISRDRARDVVSSFDEEIINILHMDTNPAIQTARKEWAKLEDAVEDLENEIDNIDNDCEDDEDETNLVNKIDEDDEDDDDIIDDCDDDIDEGGPDHEGEP